MTYDFVYISGLNILTYKQIFLLWKKNVRMLGTFGERTFSKNFHLENKLIHGALTLILTLLLVSGLKTASPQSQTRGVSSSSSKMLAAFKLLWATGGENVECK